MGYRRQNHCKNSQTHSVLSTMTLPPLQLQRKLDTQRPSSTLLPWAASGSPKTPRRRTLWTPSQSCFAKCRYMPQSWHHTRAPWARPHGHTSAPWLQCCQHIARSSTSSIASKCPAVGSDAKAARAPTLAALTGHVHWARCSRLPIPD